MTDTEVEKNSQDEINEEGEEQKVSSVESEASDDVAELKNEEPVSEDWKSKTAYLAAEIENMKKRFDREKREFLRFANEDLLKKFLPVMDNMFLALQSAKNDKTTGEDSKGFVGNLVKGFEMTLKHFEQTLESVGIEFIDSSAGTEFNPEHHEAMGQDNNKDLKDGVISSEFQRGFKLNGRVIRPARVVVNKLNAEDTDKKDGE